MITCKFASPEEFIPLCELFGASGLGEGRGYIDIRRRITVPLFLRQIITFYENSKLCGFVTFAFLNAEAEKHMPTTGILPTDWRSGNNFWAVDFIAKGDGYKMLRIATKALGVKNCRFFRHKFKEIREVRTCQVAG